MTEVETMLDAHKLASEMADRARAAQSVLRETTSNQRTQALLAASDALEVARDSVLAANARDLETARSAGRPESFIDRLALDDTRLAGIVEAIRTIARQDDPIGAMIEEWDAPRGMHIRQVRVPIGVLAVIFESRPNVVADAAAIALRSGNAVILRGGSDSLHSALAITAALRSGIENAGLPADIVQHPATPDRAFVGALLTGLEDRIDLVIPRGGRDLVARVQAEARVAVLGHLDGIVHAYLDRSVDPEQACALVLNSKMRRTGVCNALECLLLHEDHVRELWPKLAEALIATGCEIRADERAREAVADAKMAKASDWGHEFLAPILAVKTVSGLDEALAHIARYGSGHTDLVISSDSTITEAFLNAADSAVVIANATTGVSDGGEFGFGAEIGIATSRLHARGPVGARQLTTYKYQVRGTGQLRD